MSFIFRFALCALGNIVHGFVASIMWGWFVVTAFSAPALSIPTAIGLSIVLRFLINHPLKITQNTGMDEDEEIAVQLLAPPFILGIAYIVHLFM